MTIGLVSGVEAATRARAIGLLRRTGRIMFENKECNEVIG
jgi:hypothetical protein